MPTYEYKCKNCEYGFEIRQGMSEAPLSVCPECGGELRRLINGGAGVIYKGSGFYSTDKRSAAKGTSAVSAEKKAEAVPACASCPHSEGGSPCAEKAAG
jgi:putative FmdB family regulatory protein